MRLFLICLLTLLSGCGMGLDQELDFETAESLIEEFNMTGVVDLILLEESGAHEFVENDGYYLFVVNSWQGDFNGWVYTQKSTDTLQEISFEPFNLRSTDITIGNWTKVYGRW